MYRRNLFGCLLALVALTALVAAPGAWAKKAAKKPAITKVAPMRVKVGDTLTIRGRNFRSKARRNTVIFRSSNGRSAFVKPRRASRTKLVLTVSERVARLLTVKSSAQQPTRLKLRVLAGKFSSFTSKRLSPVVVGLSSGPGDGGGGGGNVCEDDSDHDNDLLSNSLEKSLGTDPCLEDTDVDGMPDGWEYYSAKDLNKKAVPYPGKRPFPNALDPSDGKSGSASAYDFDGDGLKTYEEYRAWKRTGASFVASAVNDSDPGSPLGYSDGTKLSRRGETPAVPSWKSFQYGLSNPSQPYPGTYDIWSDATVWHDDERDADADGLSNFAESSRGPGRATWWAGFYASEGHSAAAWPKPVSDTAPCDTQFFGAFSERPYQELDMTDGDVDGDGLLDGEDDQDYDDVTNIVEIYEYLNDVGGDGWLTCGTETYPATGGQGVNAFNPCAPNPASRTCDDYKPF